MNQNVENEGGKEGRKEGKGNYLIFSHLAIAAYSGFIFEASTARGPSFSTL